MQATESTNHHQDLIGFIWGIADKLRGPYRPPQYRRVMLPLIVLRRLDCILAPNQRKVHQAFNAKKAELEAKGLQGIALDKKLEAEMAKLVGQDRAQPFYNTFKGSLADIVEDSEGLAANLVGYIQAFSPQAREIFEKFEFEKEIEKLEESNRLFLILKDFCNVDLSPSRITNLEMGQVFEHLVRRFNEQANEEAGDHFTPREVIRLMVNLIFCDEEDVFKPGVYKSIYDPAAGTGGMLSVSEEHIKRQNPNANLELFGQEYNPESYAICCSDLLIKDEPIDNLIFGDTLGIANSKSRANNFVPQDGHPEKQFHYMLANPPFGVEWKPEKDFVEQEHQDQGFAGRFGAGLPRINDGSLLFLQHMISKMRPAPEDGGDGSKIAIVFNGSPLFTGDAGSGESNIRRWIIENDWLDAVVALPDQMFYNTGIYTYIWLVTNKKPEHRQGQVQLIDGTRHFQKMKKSLGNKRNELAPEHIAELVRLYSEHQHDATSEVLVDGELESRICSKVFKNREFGFLKITVERPLRLNFQSSAERIERLWEQTAFKNLATSKKRKNEQAAKAEIEAGQALQQSILSVLQSLDGDVLYKSRPKFLKVVKAALQAAEIKLAAPVLKAVWVALSEPDPTAEPCRDSKGRLEANSDLRDTEIVPLPEDIELPLPLGYDGETGHDALRSLVCDHCEAYLEAEVKPHVPEAWIDHSKTKVGYEIPLNRHFYVYQPPRPLQAIEDDIKALEADIVKMLGAIV